MFAFHALLDRIREGLLRVVTVLEHNTEMTEVTLGLLPSMVEQLDRIETKVDFIMAREQVSWDNYQANVGQLVAGYRASRVENDALREEIAGLSKGVQERITKAVDDALAADDEFDAARIDAANNALPIIENGKPVPPKPEDATPQTTENGSHDVMGDDGQPVTVPGDESAPADATPGNTADGDADATTGDPAGSDPAVNSGDDSGQTATTGDHSSANADQSTSSAN